MRFFSYYSRMPNSDAEPYIEAITRKNKDLRSLNSEFIQVASLLQLTARDLETIEKVYAIMDDQFLSSYGSIQAYLLYWALLCLKYKHPIRFNKILNGEVSTDERNYGVYFARDSEKTGLSTPLKIIANPSTLNEITFTLMCDSNTNYLNVGNIIEVHLSPFSTEDATVTGSNLSISISKRSSLSGILFAHDLLRWDEIKNLTPGEFLLKQLEMFDFIREPPK